MYPIIIPEIDQGLIVLFPVIIIIAEIVIQIIEIDPSLQGFADTQRLLQENEGAVMQL